MRQPGRRSRDCSGCSAWRTSLCPLRIGGETADSTYWPKANDRLPSKAYVVNRDYFAKLGQLARATPLSLIVDLNLAAQSPQMAQTVGRALRRWLPPSSVGGFEIGNEPDLYHAGYVGTMNISPGDGSPFRLGARLQRQRLRRRLRALRPRRSRDLAERALRRPRAVQRTNRLCAPRLAHAGDVDAHAPPLRVQHAGGVFSPNYPTQAKYLSAADTRGFAAKNRWFVSLARQAGIPVKVTEINDAVGDAPGLTNSFATALWGANTLFDLLAEGMGGVNVHLRLKYLNSPVTASLIRRADRQPALLRDAARDAHPRSRGEPHARGDDRRTSGPFRLGGPRQLGDDARLARQREPKRRHRQEPDSGRRDRHGHAFDRLVPERDDRPAVRGPITQLRRSMDRRLARRARPQLTRRLRGHCSPLQRRAAHRAAVMAGGRGLRLCA